MSRAYACVLPVILAMAGAQPARADMVTVTAKGTIAPACSLSATQNFPSSNISAAGSSVAKASVNCNQVFKISATSANGAIKNSASASPPFTNTVAYNLKADVALDNGSTSTVTCASSTLVAGQSGCALSPANSTGLSSGGQLATNKTTTLTISWTPPALPTLLKPGSYSDTITLTIASVP